MGELLGILHDRMLTGADRRRPAIKYWGFIR